MPCVLMQCGETYTLLYGTHKRNSVQELGLDYSLWWC